MFSETRFLLYFRHLFLTDLLRYCEDFGISVLYLVGDNEPICHFIVASFFSYRAQFFSSHSRTHSIEQYIYIAYYTVLTLIYFFNGQAGSYLCIQSLHVPLLLACCSLLRAYNTCSNRLFYTCLVRERVFATMKRMTRCTDFYMAAL